ncbi:uncharacterized protein LOC131167908 isoform X2 [Malania oleifera]|uniref:uncharacterized protein LOC131167908 isoform X2 n=1 Tax=Malania oleifera TaxID=397392 RepID=UPI0025ADD0C2|nr:uncharacterized protein LOC131167908 isoform X2 [Malania oleifera]
MHGRICEQRHQRRHMWPVPAPTTVAADSASVSPDFFSKDGRKICIGDSALFKPPQDSPPFIGIIRRLIAGKEEGLKLGVNWLYRPADIKLAKGNLLEAAPNEIFYSFHKDEIPAASLLHPCKVAFLRKGVELPSGISSFVCRRVYDIENKCLWWLTDQDYINERQEEVDQLLDKTRQEMHGAVQSGGRSPKPLNGPTSTPQLKPSADSVQNTSSPISSQAKGKKRERVDQCSDPVKRERLSKIDDGDSGQFRPDSMLKSEIAKITEKGGLVDLEGVEKLVQLMQPDSAEKKIDLAGRIMLVDVIAVTDRFDCLGRFVQLRGLPVLDEWLQEVHKGKIGDGVSPKESDKFVEEFLLALLRALDKLPVNLDALQTCNVGKSVNHLRSHKNSEIQKKARSLVDTWKKRVEAEMNMIDAKSGSNRGVSWPAKSVSSEGSHVGTRRVGGSSEVGIKNSSIQPSASKAPQVKVGPGEAVSKFSPVASPGLTKSPASLTTAAASNLKDANCKMNVGSGASDLPLTTIKEERSSSSSQSQNNSQSYSSDHVRTVGSCREDARSSTAGSGSVNKISGGGSRHRKSSNGLSGSAIAGVQKESGLGKFSSANNRNLSSEKVLPAGVTYEKVPDMPLDHGNNQRLIVRLPNTGRSPAQSASGGSFEEPAATICRSSPPSHSERNDHHERKFRGKSDVSRASIVPNVNTEFGQVRDGVGGADEANGSPSAVDQHRVSEDCEKPIDVPRTTGSSSGIAPKSAKSYDASFSSINALIESCVKFSEASASASAGDDVGMNLLASVAAGEISKPDIVSPLVSPKRNSPIPEDSCSGSDAKLKQLDGAVARSRSQPDEGVTAGAIAVQGDAVESSLVKNELQHSSNPKSPNFSGDGSVTLLGCEEKIGEHKGQLNLVSVDLQRNADGPCLTSDGKSHELKCGTSAGLASGDGTKDGNRDSMGANQLHEQRKAGVVRAGSASILDSKLKVRSPLHDEDKKVDCADEKPVGNVEAAASEGAAVMSTKVEKEANDDSPSCSSSEVSGKNKNSMYNELTSAILFDQKPPPAVKTHTDMERKSEVVVQLSGSGNTACKDSDAGKCDDIKTRNSAEQSEKQKVDLGSSVSDQNSEHDEMNSERMEVLGNCAGGIVPNEESSAVLHGTNKCVKSGGSKLARVEADGKVEPASSVNASNARSGMVVKLDFDLNEGLPGDDGIQGDLKSPVPGNSSAVHLPCPLPVPYSSMSGSFPASITVAAAAKGSFVPPENLLRSKGELGWKGSAATSAFRPAEPRRILEMPLSSTDVPLADASVSKQGRVPLDIDLNVPDQRTLEDVSYQNPVRVSSSETGSRERGAGLLDLDLNRADESADMAQFVASNGCRSEISSLPGRSSLSGGFSNGEMSVSRDFDLNNGPGPDEVGTEIAARSHNVKSNVPFLSPVPGLRMSSSDLGNFSSWFPPGNSYSALTIPSILSGRGEQGYPVAAAAAAAGSQRILGPPIGSTTFAPEIYRGPVLSSSPAVAYPPTAPFQYPGFPFEASFPLSSNSFSGCSTGYADSSSGGPLCFPAIPSQLVGPAGLVSSHYPRPYVMNLAGGTSNVVTESKRWGGQGLDLNAGPGTTDVERRDERMPLRQLPVASSQAMVDEQLKMYQQVAGGVLKRKEPDGGWDADRSYKQPSGK